MGLFRDASTSCLPAGSFLFLKKTGEEVRLAKFGRRITSVNWTLLLCRLAIMLAHAAIPRSTPAKAPEAGGGRYKGVNFDR